MSERYQEDPWEHDPAVSAVYRKTADLSPPTSLDDAILKAAKRATWQRRQRWVLPFSTAAVVVLSVTLLMKMNTEWEFSEEREGNTPTLQSLPSAQQTEPGRMEKPTQPYLSEPPAPAVERESAPEAAAEEPASDAHSTIPAETREGAPFSRRLAPEATLSKSTPASSDEKKKLPAPPKQKSADELAYSNDLSPLADSAGQAGKKMEEESSAALSAARKENLEHDTEQDHLKPEPWLEKIRELLDAGKKEEARKELDSFKKHYPDYTLPDDLKSL